MHCEMNSCYCIARRHVLKKSDSIFEEINSFAHSLHPKLEGEMAAAEAKLGRAHRCNVSFISPPTSSTGRMKSNLSRSREPTKMRPFLRSKLFKIQGQSPRLGNKRWLAGTWLHTTLMRGEQIRFAPYLCCGFSVAYSRLMNGNI